MEPGPDGDPCLQVEVSLAHEIGLPGELWQIEVALGEVHASSGERAGTLDVCQSDSDCAEAGLQVSGGLPLIPALHCFGGSPD